MSSQLPIGVAAVRRAVFFFRRHLRKRFLGSARLKPRVPAKMALAAGLHENLSRTLAEKNLSLFPIPVGDATLRFCRAIVQGVGDGRQPFPARRFQQPPYEGTRKVAQLVEAEGDVLDDESAISLRAGRFQLVAGDVLNVGGLDLWQRERYTEQGHPKDALRLDRFVGIAGNKNQLVAFGHAADSMTTRQRPLATLA